MNPRLLPIWCPIWWQVARIQYREWHMSRCGRPSRSWWDRLEPSPPKWAWLRLLRRRRWRSRKSWPNWRRMGPWATRAWPCHPLSTRATVCDPSDRRVPRRHLCGRWGWWTRWKDRTSRRDPRWGWAFASIEWWCPVLRRRCSHPPARWRETTRGPDVLWMYRPVPHRGRLTFWLVLSSGGSTASTFGLPRLWWGQARGGGNPGHEHRRNDYAGCTSHSTSCDKPLWGQ